MHLNLFFVVFHPDIFFSILHYLPFSQKKKVVVVVVIVAVVIVVVVVWLLLFIAIFAAIFAAVLSVATLAGRNHIGLVFISDP